MYCAYKLNNQGDTKQPLHTSFPIWNQSVVPSLVLTVASLPGYRFLRRQVRWYADDTTLKAESEKELKNFLIRVKEESEKADLKLSFKK